MRAPLSIIVPTLDSADSIAPTAACLLEGVDRGIVREVVLSDGGSADGIEAIAEELGAEFVKSARGRGTQLAAGANAAQGEWLMFLHADTRLAVGWSAAVMSHIESWPDSAGFFRLRFDASGGWPTFVAAWANFRSRRLGLPYGDQGLLISRNTYDAVGGYSEIPLMEDVEIARQLKGRLRPLECDAVTRADRYLRDGWLRRGSRNLATLARYLAGTPAKRLLDSYEGKSG